MRAAVNDSDAVISTLGPVGRARQTTICSEGVVNIARAMEELGKRRLTVVGSLIGIDPHPDASWFTSLFAKLILQPMLGYQYRDEVKMSYSPIQEAPLTVDVSTTLQGIIRVR